MFTKFYRQTTKTILSKSLVSKLHALIRDDGIPSSFSAAFHTENVDSLSVQFVRDANPVLLFQAPNKVLSNRFPAHGQSQRAGQTAQDILLCGIDIIGHRTFHDDIMSILS